MAKQALGKGLSALINKRVASPAPIEEHGERIQRLPLASITPSPLQPRVDFSSDQLHELVESIRERGIIQPLIVRQVNGVYELIAGERRWRAAKEVGLTEVPSIVREASDREVLELALIENLQREGLNPIEEAAAYTRLHQEFSLTQEEISRRVGKSRASVANAMRLLDLEGDAQSLLKHGRISVGHAKVLLSLKNHNEQKWLADQIVRGSLSVRIAEKLAAQKLADWAVTKKAYELYGKSYAIVGYPGMNPAPPNYPPSADAAMAKIDLAKMGADRARILAEWTKRYDGKSAPK